MHWVRFLCLFLSALPLWAAEDFDRQLIEKRIAPVGKVRLHETDKSLAKPETAKKEAPEKKDAVPGQAIYQKHCALCHANGLAGAPKFRDKGAWESRLKAKKMEGFVQSVTNGFNAMPPKGTCTECTETDFKNAINYMLPQ